MIASSHAVRAAALAGACAVHVALAWALVGPEPARIEGSPGTAEARLGSSFADMAAGTLGAAPALDRADRPAPDALPSAQPDHAIAAGQPAPAGTALPRPLAPVRPDPSLRAPAQRDGPAPTARAGADAPAIRPAETPALLPEAPAPAATGILAPPAAHSPPGALAETPRPAESATLSAAADNAAAIARSPRPARRSSAFEQRHAAPAPPARAAPKPAARAGNAPRDAVAGAASGKRDARATRQGPDSGRAAQSGNAAASNYPGLVMQRIARVRKPNMQRTGRARVAFVIAGSGGLSGLSVARSSGSAALDREALTLIRRAAPFPPPPAGAIRSFAIEVEFRR